MNASRLLTTAQAAQVLGVTPRTLRSWRETRTGPTWLRLGHRTVRYSRADLTRFMRESRTTGAA